MLKASYFNHSRAFELCVHFAESASMRHTIAAAPAQQLPGDGPFKVGIPKHQKQLKNITSIIQISLFSTSFLAKCVSVFIEFEDFYF